MAMVKMTNGLSTREVDERLKEIYIKVGWKEVKSGNGKINYPYENSNKK